MDVLRAEVLTHSLRRTVHCCLCGADWEEQFVAVALVEGRAVLGDLCPRCYSRPPAAAADRLRALSAELRGIDPAGWSVGPGDRVARLTEESRRLRATSRRIRSLVAAMRAANRDARREFDELVTAVATTLAESRRLCSGSADAPDAPDHPPQADESADVLVVAERVAGMGDWGTTVERVVEAERLSFRRRYGWLDDLTVRRAVDDRYAEFLAGTA